jgi:hypothetical protein
MKKPKRAKCFLFYDAFADYIEKMSDAECKQYVLALVAYHKKGKMTQFEDRFLQSAFMQSVALISESEERYKEKCKRMAKINERKKASLKAAKEEDAQPAPEPKGNTTPVEPIPEIPPEPTPINYESLFGQTTEDDTPQPPTNPEPVPYTSAKVGDIVVMNGKRMVKRSNGVFVIPTLEEVTEYVKEKGYHFQPSTFLEYYENSKPHPWHMANGNPVKAWKQCCTTFEQHVFLSEGRRAMARQQSPPTSHAHDNINNKTYEPPY